MSDCPGAFRLLIVIAVAFVMATGALGFWAITSTLAIKKDLNAHLHATESFATQLQILDKRLRILETQRPICKVE